MSQLRSIQPHDAPGLPVDPSTPAASGSLQTADQKDFISPGDVQQLLIKDEVLQIASLDQPDSEPVHIKEEEEEEELCAGQEGDQEETGVSSFSSTEVTVKSEADEEKPQFSQLHQLKMEDGMEVEPPTFSSDEHMKTETGFKDNAGPEPGRKPDPNHELQQIKDEDEDEEKPQSLQLHEIKKEENMKAELPSTTLSDYKNSVEPEPGWNPDLNSDSQQKADESEVKPQSSQLYEIKIEDVMDIGPPTFCTAEYIKTETGFMDSVGPEPGWKPDPNGDLQQISDEKPQSSRLYEIKIEDVMEVKPPTFCSAEYVKTETDFKDSVGPEPGLNPGPNGDLQQFSDEDEEKANSFQLCEIKKEENMEAELPTTSLSDFKKGVGPEPTRNPDPNSYLQQISDENEEKPNSLQLQEITKEENMEAELPTTSSADFKDSLRPEPTRNPDPKNKLQQNTDENTSDSSEAEVHDDDWQMSSESEPDAEDSENKLQEKHRSESDVKRDAGCKQSFKCSECDEEFPKMQSLRLHMRYHAKMKVFPCGVCGKRFRQKFPLEEHMRLHTGEKPFTCSQCGEKFHRKQDLTVHVKAHSGVFRATRKDGGEPCNKKKRLNRTTGHGKEKQITCEECGKCFPSKTALQVHAIDHIAEKPFICDKCGKTCSSYADLQLHLEIHAEKKPFVCDDCGHSFTQKSSLSRHKSAVHTGDKPYACDECGRRFSLVAPLKRHKYSHAKKRQVVLDVVVKNVIVSETEEATNIVLLV